jgi:acyl-CoA synthetase (NDP forming)
MPVVLRDENVHSLTITFYAGRQLAPMFPDIVEMIEAAARGVPKPVNVWIYGTSLSAMEELARQLHARAFPAYLDLDTAIKALGYAAAYSRIKTNLSREGMDECRSQ